MATTFHYIASHSDGTMHRNDTCLLQGDTYIPAVDHFINSTDCEDARVIVDQFRGELDDETLLEYVEDWFGEDSEIAAEVANLLDL